MSDIIYEQDPQPYAGSYSDSFVDDGAGMIYYYDCDGNYVEMCGRCQTDKSGCVQVTQEFDDLTTGNTVTVFPVPDLSKVVTVYRNTGIQYQSATADYTISGNVITFNVPFGISGGAVGGEKVKVAYCPITI